MRRFIITFLALVMMAARSLWICGLLLLVLALLGQLTGCGGGDAPAPTCNTQDSVSHAQGGPLLPTTAVAALLPGPLVQASTPTQVHLQVGLAHAQEWVTELGSPAQVHLQLVRQAADGTQRTALPGAVTLAAAGAASDPTPVLQLPPQAFDDLPPAGTWQYLLLVRVTTHHPLLGGFASSAQWQVQACQGEL